MQQPTFLKKHDTIGIVSTARKISQNELTTAIAAIKNWGYSVKLASNISFEEHQFAGTDEQRALAFQELLDDSEIKAIWCARGGYGSVRVLEMIDWKNATNKWIAGYSDVTAIHAHLHKLGIKSLHSTMPINFKENTFKALQSFEFALNGNFTTVEASNHFLNKHGQGKGQLVGGNLSMLYSLLGSKDQLKTNGKILFLEDLDEYLYHIDRMMMALKRAGLLSNLKGLIIGGMTEMNDNAIPFGKTAEEIIAEHSRPFNYPIAFGFPVGHIDDNRTLVFGHEYQLNVTHNGTELIPRIQ